MMRLPRIEKKFLLSFSEYVYLRDRFEQLMPADRHGVSRGHYPVLSLYFDTPNLDFFYQKINGEYEHTKIRLRTYRHLFGEGSPLFMEAKIKHNSMQQKYRCQGFDYDSLLDTSSWPDSLAGPPEDQEYFTSLAQGEPLIPTCNVFYEREAFEEGQLRINFDKHLLYLYPNELSVTRAHHDERTVFPEGEVICEIKYDQEILPPEIIEEMQAAQLEQTTFSKYATCVEFIAHSNEADGAIV